MSNQFTPGPYRYNAGSGVVSTEKAVPTEIIARYVDPHNGPLLAAAPDLCRALSQMNHMGGDERGGYCICPKKDGSAPDDQHSSGCADARAALRLAGVDIQARPSVHIKLRPKGKKRFEFLSGSGGLNHLRIHAAMFTPERAAQVVSEIKAEHGDKYETKVEAF